MSVTTIKTSILTRVLAVLGSTYSELSYVIAPEKNSFKSNIKGYGVLAGAIDEQDSVVGAITYLQVFSVVLTDMYSTRNSDSNQNSVGIIQQEKLQDIYSDLRSTNCGNASVILVNDMNIEDHEYIEASKVVVTKMNFSVMYRI